LLLVAVLAVATSLAACGSSDDSGSKDAAASTSASTTSTSASGGAAADGIKAAQAVLDEYSKIPEFSPPGKPFDAKKVMAGKKVMSIPFSSQIPVVQQLLKTEHAVAKSIGFKFTDWQNQGKADQWVQGINAAIDQKYDVIDILSIPPNLLKPQIDKARAAGIKVVSNHAQGFGLSIASNVTGAMRLPFETAGKLMGAYSIVQTGGKANALGIASFDTLAAKEIVKGIQDQYTANCPGCKLKVVNVPVTEWATGVKEQVSSGVQRDPNLNYVLPLYDGMSPYAVAGLQAAGKAGKIPIASFNGDPSVLKLVASGAVAMDVGENEDAIGMAMVDADMRAAGGLEIPLTSWDKAPLLVFDKNNVSAAGNPPKASTGYGDAYIAGFNQLWGLQ
jgi:ribose transport system substrate-binding protein